MASFPSEDLAFGWVVAAAVRRVAPRSSAELEAALRRTHPHVVVRRRTLSGELRPIWYVYRDGAALARWATGTWWQAPGVSRVRLDAEGRVVEANEVAHQLAGVEPGSLIDRSFRHLALPGDREGVEVMWQALAEFGRLDSVYTVAGPGGAPLTVEVHAELTDDDGVLVLARPILRVDA